MPGVPYEGGSETHEMNRDPGWLQASRDNSGKGGLTDVGFFPTKAIEAFVSGKILMNRLKGFIMFSRFKH